MQIPTRTLPFSLFIVLLTVPHLHAASDLNALFITVDDMNWDSVGAYGCPVENITPNIDRLASQGMRFRHGHVTIAICMPTRAVWMTGRYPHRSGALGFTHIRPGVPTLLETLKSAGFLTGILAKVPHVVPTRGKAWDVVVPAKALRVGRDPERYHAECKAFFARAKKTKQRFFLMANAQDPHRPFAGSAQEAGRKQPKQPKGRKGRKEEKRKNRARDFPGVSRTYKPAEVVVPAFLPDIPPVRREIAQYFTSVHRADEVVGAVLRALDEAGLAARTVVMFVSDHGMALPFAKTNCWYNSTRTPWVVRWPGVIEPGSFDQHHFISGIDVAPTFLDALGLAPMAGMDGRSFVPVLKGQKQGGREHVFTHINTIASKRSYPMRSVQDARFGYIFNAWSDGKAVFRNESQSGLTMKAMSRVAKTSPKIAARVKHFLYRTREEFYDYENDPAARHNLVNDPKHRATIDRLRRRLLEHMQSTNDPQLRAFQEEQKRQETE